MTIELITGTPGAGKTCYAVAKRIAPEFGRQIAVERANGSVDLVERRIVVAGIRGLVLPHERLPHTLTGENCSPAEIARWNEEDEVTGEPTFKRLPGEDAYDNLARQNADGTWSKFECTLFNWWLWCRPGDLIVCDEVQFIIPRGTLGKKPPHYIKSLEIHRHYGVDFLFITQNAQLLDTTIRNLVGLHRHVRSVLGTSLCMVYEWDHAANTERITHASKTFYKRRPAYFKLFKSTVAVIAPPKSGRAFVWMVPLLLAAGAALAWNGTARWRNSAAGAAAVAASAAPSAGQDVARTRGVPIGWYIDPKLGVVPEVAGCYAVGAKCSCVNQAGAVQRVAEWLCRESVSSYDGLVKWKRREPPASGVPAYGAAATPASAPPL